MAERYLIAIATYFRPTGLQRMLDSLEAVVSSASVDILVVDNDAKGSARSVAVNHPLDLVYVVEPEPGVAAARNRALDHFSDRYRALIFVDDDEWVSPSWLTILTTFAAETEADVVVGPVISVFLEPEPRWVQRGGFYMRRFPKNGAHLPTAPAGNTLLLRDMWVRAGFPRFDSAFSASGGEDDDFFRGVRKAGATILFCAEALVYEGVPKERVSLHWVRRRAINNGRADTRVRLKHGDSLSISLAKGIRSAVYGIVFLAVGLATGRGLQARPYFTLFFAYGKFAGLLSYWIERYSRIIHADNTH
ncbi:glycosyltransferase family 2 protein [Mycolicibacterium pallens]|uniref:Glycosyltransferase n=1 Tax=Mycolicibacterium pallens TaxID=370524 RepID=A0ABX8VNH6_9MYCO|nr:glycosyltransferase family 2 protein [Mycolicibacterium pallens]APE16985.1 hypothetical protein BOH72_18790 [Mycobacterium sp. WY10]QYL17536.1 glycosyltransferase [Mycolicibacterium pallens]